MLFIDIIGHVANVTYLIGSSFKKIIYMRLSLILAGILELWYFYVTAPDDLITSIIWGALFVLINIFMVGLYIYEHQSLLLREDDAKLYYMVFQRMEKVLFKKLMKEGHWISCPQNSIILKEGEISNSLMVLFEGRIRIETEEKTITILNPGSFVGEISFLKGGPATATAISVNECRLYCWEKKSLIKLMENNPTMDVEMMKVFSTDLVSKLVNQNK